MSYTKDKWVNIDGNELKEFKGIFATIKRKKMKSKQVSRPQKKIVQVPICPLRRYTIYYNQRKKINH